jgi:mono/diheme cytochrome c family protein
MLKQLTLRHTNTYCAFKLNAWAIVLMALLSAPSWAQTSELAEKGERIYNNYCQTCHGESLVNSGQSFDLRKLKASEQPRFEASVQNGKNQMPPWRGVVSVSDMQALWAYIRTLANDKESVATQ